MSSSASSRLEANIPKILQCWVLRAVVENKAVQNKENLALINILPEFLNQLVVVLSTSKDAKLLMKDLNKCRMNYNRTIDQLIFEYQLLRQVIFKVLEEEEVLNARDRDIIVTSIEEAISDAASHFTNKLNSIQDYMAHSLVHDLRNPLAVANAATEVIIRFPDNTEIVKNMSDQISKSIKHLNRMIFDFLDLNRLSVGQLLSYELEKCDLNKIITDVVADNNSANGACFIVHSEGECQGMWNKDGLRRIVENLVRHAVRYCTPEAPIIIDLLKDKNVATLSIHSKGEPILSEDNKIIFEQFKPVSSDLLEEGRIVGLKLVHGMVEAHQGYMEVESKYQKGTTFRVELPLY